MRWWLSVIQRPPNTAATRCVPGSIGEVAPMSTFASSKASPFAALVKMPVSAPLNHAASE